MSTARDKYLLTGATGFLGGCIRRALFPSFEVRSLGRTADNDYVADLAAEKPVLEETFDVVVHCAGKAHMVPRTEPERKAFFDVNVRGTRHLLEALDHLPSPPRCFILISSIAVYGLQEGVGVDETHPLLAADPYGRSKIDAEQLVLEWGARRGVRCAILRLPLIVGRNAPGNLGSMLNAIKKGIYLSIGDGSAKKSMVLADDVAAILPVVAQREGVYNLTDGYHPSFRELELLITSQLQLAPPRSIPLPVALALGRAGAVLAKAFGRFPVTTATIAKMTSTLTFDDSRAKQALAWNPRRVIDHFTL